MATSAFLFIYFQCVLAFSFTIFGGTQLRQECVHLSMWILWSTFYLCGPYLNSGSTAWSSLLEVKINFKRWMLLLQGWCFLLNSLPSEMTNFLVRIKRVTCCTVTYVLHVFLCTFIYKCIKELQSYF